MSLKEYLKRGVYFVLFGVPEYKTTVNVRNVMKDVYQLDFKGETIEVPAGACADVTTEFYAGAKEIKLLDKYAENIKKFDY